MNTPSHLIMTAALQKAMPRVRIATSAFLIGAVAPDIPLYLLSAAGFAYFQGALGWSGGDTARHLYGTLFYEDPVWIGLHNFFHSVVVIAAGLVLLRVVRHRWPSVSRWGRWFLLACLLHTVVDIFTHVDDGPLFLWPVNATFRFYSAVSYWDPNFYGRQFMVFELLFDAALSAYLILPWLRRRFLGLRPGAASAEDEAS